MARYSLNPVAVSHAQDLIDKRQYVLDSDWGEVQPKAEDQNAFLKSHGWETYSAWHLGLTDGAADETKARYAFVFGDFRRVHRTALIASVYRASEWRHKEIELAAHDLLQRRRRRGLFVLGHLARSTQACGCGPVGRDDRCVDVLPSGAIFLLVAA